MNKDDESIDALFGKRNLKSMKKADVESEEKYLDKKDPKRRKMKRNLLIAGTVALLGIAATIGITYKSKQDMSQTQTKMQTEILTGVQKTWDGYHTSPLNEKSIKEIKANLQRVKSDNSGDQKITDKVSPLLDTLEMVLKRVNAYNSELEKAKTAYGNGIQYNDMAQILQSRDIINKSGIDKDFNPVLGPKALYQKTEDDFHIALEDNHSTLDGNITAAIARNDAGAQISSANRQISKLQQDAFMKMITYNGQINPHYQILCCATGDMYSGKSITVKILDLKRNVKARNRQGVYDALVQASVNFPFDYKALFKDGTITRIKIAESDDGKILLETDADESPLKFSQADHGRAFDLLYSKIAQNCNCNELRSSR